MTAELQPCADLPKPDRIQNATDRELNLTGQTKFTIVAGYRGAPIYVPDRLPSNPNLGEIKLPTRLFWSGNRNRDLRKRNDREIAYEAVMSQGQPHDILTYIDRAFLLDMFDNMYLPPMVRNAWEPLIARERCSNISPFQIEVAKVFFSLPESDGFIVAGGAALIASGVVNRVTEDLDFFTTKPDVRAAVAALKTECQRRRWGFEITPERDSAT